MSGGRKNVLNRATPEVEEKSGVEFSEDVKWMLTAGSGEEGIKTFSILDDDDRGTKGRCKRILKIGVSVVAGCNPGVSQEEM